MIPRATYRLQLNAGFTFRDATALIPYLAELGVSHVYCSPYFRARPGSTHGYDAVDHNSINPEIGTREEFEIFVATLRRHALGHIADFVPNHAGIGHDNAWWMDVLANGPQSHYAPFFDIDWGTGGKVLLAVLGDPYGRVLENGELKLTLSENTKTFDLHYHTHRFPIAPKDNERAAALVALREPDIDGLHELLERQFYRLAYWRVAGDEINYRRFFDVNELAALRMENPQVFAETHRLVLELVHAGKIDGLRIDHPDGLFDPDAYFARLQRAVARAPGAESRKATAFYVLAEKITAGFEHLPASWAVHGTTGYHFTNVVNGLFVDSRARGSVSRTYRAFVTHTPGWPDVAYDCKHIMLDTGLAAEMNVLTLALARIAWRDRRTRDFTANILRRVLKEVIACFPVYRTYVTDTASEQDHRLIDRAIARAKQRMSTVDDMVFDFVRHALLGEPVVDNEELRDELRAFAMKFQQVSAPTTAKGIEDTAMYRFNRLVSLNEVGGEPDDFGTSVNEFHADSTFRANHWPHEMLTTSTHDTKRSEDVRARINVISEVPALWRKALRRWHRINRRKKRRLDGGASPGCNHEYLLYQTLIGSWPQGELDSEALKIYAARVEAYMLKAAREAKTRTSWAHVSADYEASISAFVQALLAPDEKNAFLADFRATQPLFTHFGHLNSLAQTLCKLAVPGVPDIYQGNELWDFSLVDPDNRRPVDYTRRSRELAALQSLLAVPEAANVRGLLTPFAEGRAKLYLTAKLLQFRRARPALFRDGTYARAKATGENASHICAFVRALAAEDFAFAAVPRLNARLLDERMGLPLGSQVWKDTQIELPPRVSAAQLHNVLTGETIETHRHAGRTRVYARDVFANFPAAFLTNRISADVPPELGRIDG